MEGGFYAASGDTFTLYYLGFGEFTFWQAFKKKKNQYKICVSQYKKIVIYQWIITLRHRGHVNMESWNCWPLMFKLFTFLTLFTYCLTFYKMKVIPEICGAQILKISFLFSLFLRRIANCYFIGSVLQYVNRIYLFPRYKTTCHNFFFLIQVRFDSIFTF